MVLVDVVVKAQYQLRATNDGLQPLNLVFWDTKLQAVAALALWFSCHHYVGRGAGAQALRGKESQMVGSDPISTSDSYGAAEAYASRRR
jgi:hypothetical protein